MKYTSTGEYNALTLYIRPLKGKVAQNIILTDVTTIEQTLNLSANDTLTIIQIESHVRQ